MINAIIFFISECLYTQKPKLLDYTSNIQTYLCLSKVGSNRPLLPNSLPLSLNRSYHQAHYIAFISECPSIQKLKLLIIRATFKRTFLAFPRSEAIVRYVSTALLLSTHWILSCLDGTRNGSNRYHPAANCCVLKPHVQPVPGYHTTVNSSYVIILFPFISQCQTTYKRVSLTLRI
jgi:hypothetical protein